MSAFRTQSRSGSADGSSIIPIICNNNNFAKGSEVYTTISVIKWIVHSITIFVVGLLFLYLSKTHSYSPTPTFLCLCLFHFSLCQGAPTLLSFDDARTLFHEFGSVIFCFFTDYFMFSTTSSTAWSKANYFIIFLSTYIKRVSQIKVIHLLAFLPLSYWTSHWICLNLSLRILYFTLYIELPPWLHCNFYDLSHGMHGMLSDVTYNHLAGTNVLQDFVELPSQLFEHWLSEPAVLKKHVSRLLYKY